MPSVEKDYPAAWVEYGRRSDMALASLGSFPVGLLVGSALMPTFGEAAVPIVGVLFIASLAWPCFSRLYRWRCPRCGAPFHRNETLHNPFTQKCLNCDLPLRERLPPP